MSGTIKQNRQPLLSMFKQDTCKEVSTEILFGESVEILETVSDNLVYAHTCRDDYTGYIRTESLADDVIAPSHKISAPLAHIYERPDFKSLMIGALSFQSFIAIDPDQSEENGFIKTLGWGWVWKEHIIAHDVFKTDHTSIAERFLHTPYLWGGRSVFGLDCSALVQLSMIACGRRCPRDSHMQEKQLGTDIPRDNLSRGDLVFFKGHVGIMVGQNNILNATARHMQTCVENLSDVEKSYDGITSTKRL